MHKAVNKYLQLCYNLNVDFTSKIGLKGVLTKLFLRTNLWIVESMAYNLSEISL